MAGDAVAQSRAHAELVELAELIGAPVYAEFVPNTASFPSSHPLFRGAMVRARAAICARCWSSTTCCSRSAPTCSRCRCRPTSSRCRPASTIIHLDVDPWELGKNYPAEVAILGDPKGDAARADRGGARAHASGARGAARERLKSASERSPPSAKRWGKSARARAGIAGAAAGAAPCDRRDAAERTRWWSTRRCRRRPASAN